MTYQIQAVVSWDKPDGWRVSAQQIPTFFLDSSVQGITSAEHAARVGASTVDPQGAMTVSLTAYCEHTGDYASLVREPS